MFELYVYYRVSAAHARELLPRVRAMQAALAVGHSVGTALKCRPEAEPGLQTWMEIYTGAAPGFDEQLVNAVAAAGIPPLIEGGRHTETFTEMPPCA